jgi:ATP-dependent protease Clp ATPase subunit
LKSDVILRMTREFRLEGFELLIEEDVLDHIVDDALRRETGARGLASTLTRHLEDVAFGAFGVSPETTTGVVRVLMRGGDLAVELD